MLGPRSSQKHREAAQPPDTGKGSQGGVWRGMRVHAYCWVMRCAHVRAEPALSPGRPQLWLALPWVLSNFSLEQSPFIVMGGKR